MKGVINEGLRLSGGVGRLARSAPDEALQYMDWTIPPGVILSQSAYFIHMNSDLFPDPHVFDPERWVRAQESGKRLEHIFVPFTKGARQCLGINFSRALPCGFHTCA
ncbi:hypothetical protein PMG11_09925 [Penicillium brasilianum]|uniref:Cytochrome P450 n=1 Tax=Penicillium brasilianum TaxID=104259 RepID=A0A0F7U141_PENBI|nr:hypothetical protein PMG11_09925 [Penicillium brasilianum]